MEATPRGAKCAELVHPTCAGKSLHFVHGAETNSDHFQSSTVERLWHLIVPPIMTMLDDYQAAYKLRGIHLVSQLLVHTPPDLLRRTGVNDLIMQSLKTSLTFMQHPETPALIRAAVPAYLKLIDRTAPRDSAARFNQCCALLGESIIGNIWIYASQNADTIEATLDVLPEIVGFLSLGAARYLKVRVIIWYTPCARSAQSGPIVGTHTAADASVDPRTR